MVGERSCMQVISGGPSQGKGRKENTKGGYSSPNPRNKQGGEKI